MTTRLTDAEIDLLSEAFGGSTPSTLLTSRVARIVADREEKARAEGGREALLSAADDVKDRRTFGLRDGERMHPTAEHFETWLRARAASAPTEGEQR